MLDISAKRATGEKNARGERAIQIICQRVNTRAMLVCQNNCVIREQYFERAYTCVINVPADLPLKASSRAKP